jgi:hypothetical protein
MEDNSQGTVGFDLDEWKKKGEQAYEALDERIQGIEAHIKELQEQKAEVEAEKTKLGQALGIEEMKEVPKRVKIRPRVMEILEGGISLTKTEMFETIKQSVPRIKRASFDEAVRRMVTSDEVPVVEVDGKLSIQKTQ